MQEYTRTERYVGRNSPEAQAMFEADAREAVQAGYRPILQTWSGATLTVVYQYQAPVPEVARWVQPPVAAVEAISPTHVAEPAAPSPAPVTAKENKTSAGQAILGVLVMGALIWFFLLRSPGGTQATPAADHGGSAGGAPVQRSAADIGDGTLTVGTDVEPGVYRNRAPATCYWARLSGFSGELDDIIANDNVMGYGIVTIRRSDVGFESAGCEWSKDTSAVLAPGAVIPDGTFGVGVDIAPGKYRSSGDCYWARLSGFSGELDDIIANDNATGPAVVSIAKGDLGFESFGCGGWTKV